MSWTLSAAQAIYSYFYVPSGVKSEGLKTQFFKFNGGTPFF